MALIRFDAFLGRNCHDLSRLHVPHKGGADGIQGAGLTGQDVSVITLADTKGAEAMGVSGSDELSGGHDDQGNRLP